MSESNKIKNIIQFLLSKPKISILMGLLLMFTLGVGMKSLVTNFSYRIWFDVEIDGTWGQVSIVGPSFHLPRCSSCNISQAR